MKKWITILLAVTMLVGMATSAGANASPTPKAKEDMTIGFSIHFKTDDYGAICTQGFEETCQANGVKYELTDANGDVAKQLADIESLIAKQVDAIVVSPLDEKALIDVCNAAAEKGIAIIPITYMPEVAAISTVETGNYEFSYEVATKLAEAVGNKGKIAIITAAVNLWRIDQRLLAFQDVIDANPDMELVAIEKKMEADEAMAAAEAIMTANPDIAGIWGTYSNLVYGPGNTAKNRDNKDIVVGGVDADMSILNLMEEGWIKYVAAQNPYSHGKMGAEIAIQYLSGEEVPQQVIAEYKIYSADEAELCAQEIWGKTLQQ